MGYFFNTSDINQTFIIEPLSVTGGTPIVSACTALYTNDVISCDYNTSIFLGDGVINFNGNLYTNDNLTASTINASTFYSGGTNMFDIINQNGIIGGSFSANTLTLNKSDNSKIYVTGFTDYYTTGATLIGNTVYFDRNDTLSAYTVNLSKYTADTYVTGVSFTNNQIIITRNDNFSTGAFINTMTGLTINGLLSSSSISASSISVINLYTNSITALTLTSNTINVNSLNANIISATTYQNLPIDIRVTGATYNNNTFTYTNNTGDTFSVLFNTVTGLTVNGGLTSNSISAATYQNLPIDVRVTGGTYSASSSTIIFTNNTGGTFNVTGVTATGGGAFTGGTVTGATIFTAGLSANTISATTLTVAGSSNLNGSISALTLTGTTTRMVEVSSAGTISATNSIINAYLSSGSTAAIALSNSSNWSIYGEYIGSSITGTYMGQKHYDDNYFYEAVADNVFIRLIRG